jgi:uncharacterized protein (TIGR02147 family)
MQTDALNLKLKSSEVFSFTDYRAFLQTHYSDKKRAQKGWSYGAWAKKLGLKNSTSILKILNGSREAGPEITEKLIQYFNFNEKERRYFEDLISLSKADQDPARKVAIMDRLRRSSPKAQFVLLDDKTFAAISRWWFYGIRQFSKLKAFRFDADWIAGKFRFKVTARDVSSAIKTMSELGLLSIDPETQQILLTGKSLNTSDDVASEALKRFHEEVLALARTSIRAVPVSERQVSGITLAVKAQDLPRMKAFLRKFEDEFMAEFGSAKDTDTVYQLESALFPLTKTVREGVSQ